MKKLLQFIGIALLTLCMAFTGVDKKTVVIDVAHGGQDNGSTIEGFQEKAIALNVANKIKALNRNSAVEIILTREADEFISLRDRAKHINKLQPDMVISLHVNQHTNTNKQGIEIYLSDENKERAKSADLASKLLYGFEDKKVAIKKAGFYLLKQVDYPIALVELGFLSNENDRQLLTSEKGQDELATRILNAISEQ
ncbi:N-acetylmuramoyl-L-alanine amidase [Mesonia sp. HuA40]|uniref:N-acetylmuramoyl-L-alanine amidase family protein n=1 Tax=Mesonia sp. HuA40 TaxID=2602761 RepID=UPI0011C93A83|nr:N-acetylmuramoyl-L-alanine amidase [Mesonia sp. HuA40]TXK73375.1 N-acetylmuramoyl-L-alanine amidase [Mesonia sp. HuA40]